MIDSYKTIKSRSEGIYKEKGSKFIGICLPVRNESDIQRLLDELRSQYHDARHHCYAWILDGDREKYRVNDDGEPAHSAGDPILNQIRSHELTNVLVVVIRYFGGTKLGVPGLINAYKESTRIAIENGRTISIQKVRKFTIRHSYEVTSEILSALHKLEAKIVDQQYQADCIIIFEVPVSQEDHVRAKLQELEQRNFLTQES